MEGKGRVQGGGRRACWAALGGARYSVTGRVHV